MASTARRPNVVLFISDQQRADTMPGMRTADVVRTPHLEWLARQGTVFHRAYSVAPICTPARAALLTGLYPHATGMIANNKDERSEPKRAGSGGRAAEASRPRAPGQGRECRLPADAKVLADYLKPLGYRCGYVGKWHLGTGSDRRGFNDFVSRTRARDADHLSDVDTMELGRRMGIPVAPNDPGNILAEGYDRHTRLGLPSLPLAFHPATHTALQAVRFIHDMHGRDEPFLLAYSCHEPHPGFNCPYPFHRMYPPEAMPLPDSRRDTEPARLLAKRLARAGHPDREWAESTHLKPAALYSDEQLRAMWAAYYSCISYVDHLLGLILWGLTATSQLDDTLLIYTSDHGEMLGSQGLVWKGCGLYEELLNVPLLIRPPGGLRQGHTTQRLVSHVDLLPTVLRWCGAPYPPEVHGKDIRALVEGGDTPVREGVASGFHAIGWDDPPVPLRGWRTEGWRYVESPEGGEELYDVRRDPHQRHNLIDDPGTAPARESMATALHTWLRAVDDPWPHGSDTH